MMATKNECTICLCTYNKPKIIPCYHTFCEACLKDHVSKSARDGHFLCPLCRNSILIPEGGVEKFNNNFYIDEEQEACSTPDMATCPQHGKEMNLFCEVCQVPICLKCLLDGHNGHNVTDLNEVITKTSGEIEALIEIVGSEEQRYDEYESLMSAMKCSINSQTDMLCKEITSRADDICKEIKSLAERMTSEIKSQHGSKTGELTNQAAQIVKHKPVLKETPDIVGERSVLKLLAIKTSLELKLKESVDKDLTIPNQRLLTFTKASSQPDTLLRLIGKIEQTPLTEKFILNFKLNPDNKITFKKIKCLNLSTTPKNKGHVRGVATIVNERLDFKLSRVKVPLRMPITVELKLVNVVNSLDHIHVKSALSKEELQLEDICDLSDLKESYLKEDKFSIEVTFKEYTEEVRV